MFLKQTVFCHPCEDVGLENAEAVECLVGIWIEVKHEAWAFPILL